MATQEFWSNECKEKATSPTVYLTGILLNWFNGIYSVNKFKTLIQGEPGEKGVGEKGSDGVKVSTF